MSIYKLPPKEDRDKDWPKKCLVGWCKSTHKWSEQGKDRRWTKIFEPNTMIALNHALQMNLLYIEELENELRVRNEHIDQ